MANALLPTTVVGSYPQPDWLVNREMLSKVVPRTRMQEIWRIAGAVPRAGAGRRHPARHPRHGARRHRHHHRRRDAPRELLQPLRHRARRHRHRQSRARSKTRSGQMTPVPRVVGKIRRTGPVEVRDMQFLRAQHRPPAKITLPGPFTMGQQAQERVLQGRRGDGDGLRRRGQRGGARPAAGGRRRDPARRAVAAQRSRRRPSATPSRRSTARCRASRCRPWCISASATRRWCRATPSRPATPSCRSSPTASPSRSRSRRRSRSSTSAC